ncbi:MAG TPA: heme A synthase [Gammaproteobacteria bacterium]|nr:heme A synthase [Gammaproteobacteria bacterium]
MVVLGGVTRLTGSGLSMVQWQPIMGVLPPLSQEEWEHTFSLYQQFPEYKLKNLHMSLDDFKGIFWLEYAHRLLGRLIGLIFLIPFLYFLIRGRISASLVPKLVTMFLLGGLQGLMGWYMVKSGLVDNPRVSQYRLTAHLALAVVVYSYIFWVALDLLLGRRGYPYSGSFTRSHQNPLRFSLLLTGFIFLTILSGGFVAGTRAGFTFNTFPLMAGQFYPEGMYVIQPWWRNWFENIATVQFNHRVLATVLFFVVPLFWWSKIGKVESSDIRTALHLLLAALAVQISLGIATLLYAVPVPLAAAHQAGALALLTVSLYLSNRSMAWHSSIRA